MTTRIAFWSLKTTNVDELFSMEWSFLNVFPQLFYIKRVIEYASDDTSYGSESETQLVRRCPTGR